MKIEMLFELLEKFNVDSNSKRYFKESGMVNKFDELTFGFFPLGKGVLSEKLITPESFKVMILGNDFGIKNYLKECLKNGKKESKTKYPTIRNLLTKLDLNLDETFFTNLHMGLRISGTNTKRETKITEEYKKVCYGFLKHQINEIDPIFIVCLGHEVRQVLYEQSKIEGSNLFSKWGPKSVSIKRLYDEGGNFKLRINDKDFGKKTFIIMPHPCDTRNFKTEYFEKVNNALKN